MTKFDKEPYKTVAICGDFDIAGVDVLKAKEIFEKHGFEVIFPTYQDFEKKQKNYAYYKYDNKINPGAFETENVKKIAKADVVFCCNKDGNVPNITLFELGYLSAKGCEVFFQEYPNEQFLLDIIMPHFCVTSPDELCKAMKNENEIWAQKQFS